MIRTVLHGGVCAALLMFGALAHGAEGRRCPGPVTVFSAARVITMEPALPSARVVAVRDGRILGVGRTAEDLAAWTRECPTTFEDRFAEAVMLPGLIDPHLHPMLAAVLLPRELPGHPH